MCWVCKVLDVFDDNLQKDPLRLLRLRQLQRKKHASTLRQDFTSATSHILKSERSVPDAVKKDDFFSKLIRGPVRSSSTPLDVLGPAPEPFNIHDVLFKSESSKLKSASLEELDRRSPVPAPRKRNTVYSSPAEAQAVASEVDEVPVREGSPEDKAVVGVTREVATTNDKGSLEFQKDEGTRENIVKRVRIDDRRESWSSLTSLSSLEESAKSPTRDIKTYESYQATPAVQSTYTYEAVSTLKSDDLSDDSDLFKPPPTSVVDVKYDLSVSDVSDDDLFTARSPVPAPRQHKPDRSSYTPSPVMDRLTDDQKYKSHSLIMDEFLTSRILKPTDSPAKVDLGVSASSPISSYYLSQLESTRSPVELSFTEKQLLLDRDDDILKSRFSERNLVDDWILSGGSTEDLLKKRQQMHEEYNRRRAEALLLS